MYVHISCLFYCKIRLGDFKKSGPTLTYHISNAAKELVTWLNPLRNSALGSLLVFPTFLHINIPKFMPVASFHIFLLYLYINIFAQDASMAMAPRLASNLPGMTEQSNFELNRISETHVSTSCDQEPGHAAKTGREDTFNERGTSETRGEVDQEGLVPNGGYGWVCVACLFMMNAHTWGINSVSSDFPLTHLEFSNFAKSRSL